MRRLILSSSLLLALAAPAMAGSIYKWVDAQGTTHFGAQPPQGVAAERINPIVPQPSSPSEASKADPKEQNSDKQSKINAEVKEQVAADQEAVEAYCLRMRTNLAQLLHNPRISVEEENGELRRIPEEERQAKIAEAQKGISEHCD